MTDTSSSPTPTTDGARAPLAPSRIAFLHTGAVVIPTFTALAREHLPGVEIQHLLDSTIVGDLGRGHDPERIAQRLADLGDAARAAGSEAIVVTCSSISGYVGPLADALGMPVLRIDEAMADEAVATGDVVTVIATLPTTLRPTVALVRERAAIAERTVDVREALVEGAFEAVVAGDSATHDRLVGEAIVAAADVSDVIVLAQASMAGAAATVGVAAPVLTSPERGIRRAAERLLGSR